ncbi:hypothetical protein K32_23880 [Kaistia sp. 32K]|uniref:YmfQ family protein n=1 Tax=Kaistia sp. 32K TaxID=2795690 RepID=UPI001914F4E5|nr:putative phage tail protein [Kaistia sp. 32K]BCP53771.1 hypothetical protein K32_23880 [Kaistia sp. 32K]
MLGSGPLGTLPLAAQVVATGVPLPGVQAAGLTGVPSSSETEGLAGAAAAGRVGSVVASLIPALVGVALIGAAGVLGWANSSAVAGASAAAIAGPIAEQAGPAAPSVQTQGVAGALGRTEQELPAGAAGTSAGGAPVASVSAFITGVASSGVAGAVAEQIRPGAPGAVASAMAGILVGAPGATVAGVSSAGVAGGIAASERPGFGGAVAAGLAGGPTPSSLVPILGVGSSGATGSGLSFVKGASPGGVAAPGIAGSFGMSLSTFPVAPGVEASGIAGDPPRFGQTAPEAAVSYGDAGYLYVDIQMPAPPPALKRDAADYAEALAALLPVGAAWPRQADKVLMKLVDGMAVEWARIDNRGADLLNREVDPRTATEMLDAWEAAFRLPDPCNSETMTVEQRQAALVARMTALGAQSRAYFTRLAESLGYPITITEYSPYMAGVSECGDTRATTADDSPSRWQLGDQTIRFYWTVHVRGNRLSWFRAGSGEAGVDHHLEFSAATDLECVLRRWKPAHTELIFDYSGVATDGAMTGTP